MCDGGYCDLCTAALGKTDQKGSRNTHAHVDSCEERFQDVLHVFVCVVLDILGLEDLCRAEIFLNLMVGHGSYCVWAPRVAHGFLKGDTIF